MSDQIFWCCTECDWTGVYGQILEVEDSREIRGAVWETCPACGARQSMRSICSEAGCRSSEFYHGRCSHHQPIPEEANR